MFKWCLFKRIPGFGSFTTGAGGYDFIKTVIVGKAYDIVMNTLNINNSPYCAMLSTIFFILHSAVEVVSKLRDSASCTLNIWSL